MQVVSAVRIIKNKNNINHLIHYEVFEKGDLIQETKRFLGRG